GVHTGVTSGLHYVCPDMARLAMVVGDTGLVGRLAADLRGMVDAQPTPTLRGILAYCEGNASADPERLLAAADILLAADRPLYHGYAQEAAATILAAAGRITEARAALAAALDRDDRLHATRDASRGRARLA